MWTRLAHRAHALGAHPNDAPVTHPGASVPSRSQWTHHTALQTRHDLHTDLLCSTDQWGTALHSSLHQMDKPDLSFKGCLAKGRFTFHPLQTKCWSPRQSAVCATEYDTRPRQYVSMYPPGCKTLQRHCDSQQFIQGVQLKPHKAQTDWALSKWFVIPTKNTKQDTVSKYDC